MGTHSACLRQIAQCLASIRRAWRMREGFTRSSWSALRLSKAEIASKEENDFSLY